MLRPCGGDLVHPSLGCANDFLEEINTATHGWRSGTCRPTRLANRRDHDILRYLYGELIQQSPSASVFVIN